MHEGVTLHMGKIDLNTVEIIIFGDFSVLTNTPFRDHAPLAMLPGRVEYLAHLRKEREQAGGPALRYAVTGNKGGVAFGLGSEDASREEVRWTAEQISAEAWRVCFAHPAPAAGLEKYADPDELKRRKPAPGMLKEIIAQLGVPKERVLVVGNYADDCRAAKAIGVAYEVTGVFFANAERFAAGTPVSMPGEQLEPLDNFDPFLD